MSESQGEKKEEKKPDLEPFLGLIEHISRSFDYAISLTADLPNQLSRAIRDNDNLEVHKKTEANFELGRIYQILKLLHKFSVDNMAENFYSRPKNVKRFMTIMSYLAEAYWAYRDGTVNDFSKVESAIEEAVENLEDYLIDVINAMISGDDYDDDESDDDPDDDPDDDVY
jgi:hypothetical protein